MLSALACLTPVFLLFCNYMLSNKDEASFYVNKAGGSNPCGNCLEKFKFYENVTLTGVMSGTRISSARL